MKDESVNICFVEGEFQRVSVGPDDVIVLSCPEDITQEVTLHIKGILERKFPGHKCLILPNGMELKAMAPEEAFAGSAQSSD